jgi:hypothetical protein
MVERFGGFSKIISVVKKAKRIGPLFSTADRVLDIAPERCEDIPDIEDSDNIFTDGCGLISRGLTNRLVRVKPITFRNRKYIES